MQSKKPDPVDVHVGGRVRLRRMLLGMSQEELGNRLGLTFQQIQKYERGANRIGASRLYKISRILEVPVSFLFDDMDNDEGPSDPGVRILHDGAQAPAPAAMNTEATELIRIYYGLSDPRVRKQIFELIKAVAAQHDGQMGEPDSAKAG